MPAHKYYIHNTNNTATYISVNVYFCKLNVIIVCETSDSMLVTARVLFKTMYQLKLGDSNPCNNIYNKFSMQKRNKEKVCWH